MRIFLISNMYPSKKFPDFGVFVKNFKNKLEARGAKFPCINVIDQKDKTGFEKLSIYINHYILIFRNYLKSDFDIIYIHYLSHNAPIFLVLLSVLRKKSPIVVNVHGSDIIKYNTGLWKICNEFLLKRTDMIVVPSHYFRQIVINKFPFIKGKDIVVNPSGGIDFKVFYPEKTKDTLDSEVLKIGFVSRIEKGKGWDLYLKSLSILKDKKIKFKAIIAGHGNQITEMHNLIHSLELVQMVQYLGAIKQDKLREIYCGIDVFVFSSVREAESLGLVGIEAMACGTPIIASNMAGPKTYVKNDINGFLVEPSDYEGIAEALIKYKNLSPLIKEKIRNEALTTALDFDSEATADSLYKELNNLFQRQSSII